MEMRGARTVTVLCRQARLPENPLAMAAGSVSPRRSHAGAVQAVAVARCATGRWIGAGRARGRHPASGQCHRVAVDAVLHRSPGARLSVGNQREHRQVRRFLPRNAGARRLAFCPPHLVEAWLPVWRAHHRRRRDRTVDVAVITLRAAMPASGDIGDTVSVEAPRTRS